MRINTKRIYMNEADASPGNGAPAAPAAPAEPPAETAAPAPAPGVTVDQVKTLMNETLSGFKNAFFADLRKAGALGKDKPAEPTTVTPTPASPTAAAPALTGLSAADVQAILDQDRVITRAQVENKLTDSQVKRMRSALAAEKPEDVSTWTGTYLADMGLVRTTATQPATQTPTQAPAAPAKPNLSDRGTAAPTDSRDHNGVLYSRPLEMTSHDVDALILQHGQDKGMQMFQEQVLRALGNVRIKPPRG